MQQRPLKVLLVGHGLGLEGAPRVFVNLARGLAALGVMKPEVLAHEDGPLRASLEQANIPVSVLPAASDTPPLPNDASGLDVYVAHNLSFLRHEGSDYSQELETLAALVAQHDPDVVIANTILAFWAIGAAKSLGIPSIWIIHESEEPFSHLRILGESVVSTLPSYLEAASRVVFVATTTANLFRSVGKGDNFTIIPNALFPDMPVFDRSCGTRQNARTILNIAQDTVSLLMLGSVFERKGQLDLVQAMALLPADVLAAVRCDFVGDRPGTEYSLRFHEALRFLPATVRARIQVFEETEKVAPHYTAADIFIFCSRIESSPLVILEAMSVGLPIITTPVFGVRSLLSEDSSLFYQPGDAASLARHVTQLVRDAAFRRRLSAASLKCYRDIPDCTVVIDAYYATIIGVL